MQSIRTSITAAPGEDQIGLQRHDAFQVHSLPGGNLFDMGGLRWIIGKAAHRNGRDPGGKRQFRIGRGESDHPRRGDEPGRSEQKQGDQRPE